MLPSCPQFMGDHLADHLICECVHRINDWSLRTCANHLGEQMTVQQFIRSDQSLVLPNAGDLAHLVKGCPRSELMMK